MRTFISRAPLPSIGETEESGRAGEVSGDEMSRMRIMCSGRFGDYILGSVM